MTATKKLTPTSASSLMEPSSTGGHPIGSPEAKAAIERVKAMLHTKRMKGTGLTLTGSKRTGGNA